MVESMGFQLNWKARYPPQLFYPGYYPGLLVAIGYGSSSTLPVVAPLSM